MLLHIVSRNQRTTDPAPNPNMPFSIERRHHRRARLQHCARLLLLLPVLAAHAVPGAAGAAELVPRACDDMSFKVIAQMMDAASNFETRLVLLGRSSLQDRNAKLPGDEQDGVTASDMEAVNVGALRNSLGEVWGYLLAAENLAAVRDLTVDEHDRAAVDRQLKLVAQQIQEPLTFGLESAENVSAATKRPGVTAEVSKIRDFMDEMRTQFAPCAGRLSR
jgi:hypothetical protein